MSITQRQEPQIKIIDLQNDRSSTQHLEKILLSSSSSSSQRKLASSDLKKIILTTQELTSNGAGTQRTAHNGTGGMFNNTGRNWRTLITPAQDSLNKLQQQQPEYSGYNPGSRVTTQNDKPIGATSNSQNTSMDTSNLSLSVKQFTPSQDLRQLKMTLRAGNSQQIQIHNHQSSLVNNNASRYHKSKQSYLNDKNHLDTIQDEETKSIKQSYLQNDHFGASTSQMRSLMKSYSNGNFEFFENLQRKYFQNAKDKSQKSSKPPTSSQFGLDRSEKDLFNLTSKTNTQLGISQFKSSIQSLGKSQNNDRPSVLRASSLKDQRPNTTKSNNQEQNNIRSAMSINFKNSLYKKINPSNNILDDNSQSQLDNKSKIMQDRSLQRKFMQSFNLDSSDSSEKENDYEDDKQPINLKSHIKNTQIQVLGSDLARKMGRRDQHMSKDSLEEAIFKSEFNVLSRRDLSSRMDEKSPASLGRSSNDKSQDRQNKFHRPNSYQNNQEQNQFKIKSKSRQRSSQNQNIDDSSSSLNLFHRLLSSGHNNMVPKVTSQMSSVLLSNPDFNIQSQYRQGDTHIIFEQPTKEDALEDTYKGNSNGGMNMNNLTNNEQFDLKPEDLTTIVENGFNSQIDESSQLSSQNEVLETFKQYLINARNQIFQQTGQDSSSNSFNKQHQIRNHNTQKTSNYGGNSQSTNQQLKPYQQSANPDRQRTFIGQSNRNSNIKEANLIGNNANNQNNVDQKSDFTFVLSNPTDFQCECCNNNGASDQNNNPNNQSIVTNKLRKQPSTAQNSDLKSQKQNFSSYRKGPFQTIGQPSRLQEFAASPIFSENGGLPGHQFYMNIPVGVCQNCGGCKSNQPPNIQKKQNSNVQHRLSYNQMNYQSIKEESQDGDDEYYKNQNFVHSQINDSSPAQQNLKVVYNQVFDYPQQQQQQQQQQQNSNQTEYSQQSKDQIVIQSGETSLEGNQNLVQTKISHQDEELKKLQTIISFSQEYMSKLLQDQSASIDLKSQLAQLFGLLSSVQNPSQIGQFPSSMFLNNLRSNTKSNINPNFQSHINLNANNTCHNHLISQQTTLQPASVIFDNNMTISELQQIQQQRQQQQHVIRANNNNNNNIIHEEVSTAQDESLDQSLDRQDNENNFINEGTFNQRELKAAKIQDLNLRQKVNDKKDKQRNLKQYSYAEFEQLPKNLRKKYHNLKNSLISSSCEADPNFINKLKEETVYSYVDVEDDEEDEDEKMTLEDSFDREEDQKRNMRHAALNTLRHSEFASSRHHYQSQNKHSALKLRQSQYGNVASYIRALDIKKSLKKTKRSLLSTKMQLRKEKYLNQEREDMHRKMQAEIQALNERQKMTEDKIQAKENMISLLQRINSQHSTSVGLTSHSQSNTVASLQQIASSFQGVSTNNISANSMMQNRDTSPNMRTNTSQINNNISSSNNLGQASNNHTNQNINTNSSFSAGHLDQSSKHLLEINDRLTKQIEDNLALFEDLNQELTNKDHVIAENQARLTEKQQEIEQLTRKINDMGDSMKKLIEVTKSSHMETEQSKQKHNEQMEKIKQQQKEYQKKIDKIQSVYANISAVTINSLYNNKDNQDSASQQIYSKYQKKPATVDTNAFGGSNSVLKCIPLSSPRTSHGINIAPNSNSNNSSRIQDEEFSIGQIVTKLSLDATDTIQSNKLSHNSKSRERKNKENLNPKQENRRNSMKSQINSQNQRDDSLLNSRTLKSLYNDLKESVVSYNQKSNQFKETGNTVNAFNKHDINSSTTQNDTTLLKYSQDATHSLINTKKINQ